MTRIWLFSAAIATSASTLAQAQSSQPKLLRWTEDYSLLRLEPERPFPLSLKYLPLTDDGGIYLSLGAEARVRVDAYDHPLFGLTPAGPFASLQSRMLIHADLHAGPDRRFFLQLGAFDERGREPSERSFDEGALDIQLMFADFGTPETYQLRVGRQEIVLPGGRNAAVRDATNIRRAFDGVKLGIGRETYAIDAFITAAVELREGAFDDRPNDDEHFWGIYATTVDELISDATVDFFYLARNRERAVFAEGIGDELRHMIGTRVALTRGPFDLDAQAGLQLGRFGDGEIFAWHLAADAGYAIDESTLAPRLSLRVEIASGDDSNGDGDLGTYDPLYPNGTYVTDAALLLPGNSIDIQPALSITPLKGVRLTGGVDFFWRLDKDDGVYQPSGAPLVPPGGTGRFVSAQPFLRAVWKPTPNVEVVGAVSYATAGEVIDSAGGEGLSYGLVQIALRF
jgi:hypothetical protein